MKKTSQILIATLLLTIGLAASALGQASDAALKAVIEKDRSSRGADGKLVTLSASEHLQRGSVYFDNRSFPASREHFQKIFDNFATDPEMSGALFMTGRGYYWEREYNKAIPYLDRVSREYASKKDGREGLYFAASCHVRMSRHVEAAKLFEKYTVMYPTGERIDGAYLNTIDALRESMQYDAANEWVEKVRAKFAGQPTETNALHARMRMQIYRALWADAIATAALIEGQAKLAGSMTSLAEVRYLRAFSLEKQNNSQAALAMYASVPVNSYYGGLAMEKVAKSKLGTPPRGLQTSIGPVAAKPAAKDFPVPFRLEVLQYAKKNKLDPRYVLAIMKQESSFRADVKSPSAARGLLQLVMDTALKYNKKAGFGTLQPDDLYSPRINIAIGCEYLGALRDEFGGLYEAMAASYNGGEDNAARWLNRSKPKDPGIFVSEIGFPETKNYVFKVMTNYRSYRELYDENLTAR